MRSGELLALLYFTNCLGAAVGVLVSGFVLIERLACRAPSDRRPAEHPARTARLVPREGRARSRSTHRLSGDRRPQTTTTPLADCGSLCHRADLVPVRDGLDSHAEPCSGQLDAFIRAHARGIHLRTGDWRLVDPPPHRSPGRSDALSEHGPADHGRPCGTDDRGLSLLLRRHRLGNGCFLPYRIRIRRIHRRRAVRRDAP